MSRPDEVPGLPGRRPRHLSLAWLGSQQRTETVDLIVGRVPAPLLAGPAPQGLRSYPPLRLPRQPSALHSAAALLPSTRHSSTADRTRNIYGSGIEPAVALSQVWWTHAGHRTPHSSPDSTPLSTSADRVTGMKPRPTFRSLCVLATRRSCVPCCLRYGFFVRFQVPSSSTRAASNLTFSSCRGNVPLRLPSCPLLRWIQFA